MLRQYGAQRFRPSLPMVPVTKGKGTRQTTVYVPQEADLGYRYRIGTIPIGTIAYIQDDHRPIGATMQTARLTPRRMHARNPWVVVAWLNREYYPAVHGKGVVYMRGGHLAVVKSLRDGRTKTVADWVLLQCVDAGLTRD